MRVLLINNHCITDPTAGVTQSLRTCMRWLGQAGHGCRVLTTARFETPVTFTLDEHLAQVGVAALGESPGDPCAVLTFEHEGLPITLVRTRHHNEMRPDDGEARQYVERFLAMLDESAADVVVACNAHPMIRACLRLARARGIVTVFSLRGYGYTDRRYFEDVDHVFAVSEIVAEAHAPYTTRRPVTIHPPIAWEAVEAAAAERQPAFVTFINPDLRKGVMLFARLADMLGARRPDIPVLVVQSGRDAGLLNRIPGIDFTRYPQVLASPPVARARDVYALTRVLLVPSVWPEPFGRVAAEAMINGIPAIVSERGSLGLVIGGDLPESERGGMVVALPACIETEGTRLPTEAEAQPWYEAVVRVWDDAAWAARLGANGRRLALERYSEAGTRAAHVSFFEACMAEGKRG